MNSFQVTASDVQRNYKNILAKVKANHQRAILMNRDEPQAVITTLEEINELDQYRRRNSGQKLLELTKEVQELLKDEHLPSDLAANHDYYLWEETNQPQHKKSL